MKNIMTLFILGILGYGIFYLFGELQLLKKIECLGVGKTPISSYDLGAKSGEPTIVCAEPTTDGGKECYDSSECSFACILDKNSQPYSHAGDFISQKGSDLKGQCQEFEENQCFVERKHGIIVIHKCSQ